jgi:putative nucleotidyltransferase with HDIG domain
MSRTENRGILFRSELPYHQKRINFLVITERVTADQSKIIDELSKYYKQPNNKSGNVLTHSPTNEQSSIDTIINHCSSDIIIVDYETVKNHQVLLKEIKGKRGRDMPVIVWSTNQILSPDKEDLKNDGVEGFFENVEKITEKEIKIIDEIIKNRDLRDDQIEEVIVSKVEELMDGREETKEHMYRVADMMEDLALMCGMTPLWAKLARRGALLHDIGKSHVPNEILNKDGKLTDEEWIEMKKHPNVVDKVIQENFSEQQVEDFLYEWILYIPKYHHEKWNGLGYPYGLKGKEIPLAARLFALVDIYDARINKRVYHDPISAEQIIQEISLDTDKGLFDKYTVEIFIKYLQTKGGNFS